MVLLVCCFWLQSGVWLPLEGEGQVFLKDDPMMADMGVTLEFDELKWKGKIADGKAQGKGTLKGFKDGRQVLTYKGEMKDGMFDCKKGRLIVNGPAFKFKYVGHFVAGVRDGEGRIDWVKSTMTFDPRFTIYYEGGWRDNLFDGEGTFVQRNEKYVGEFSQGMYHGQGTRYVREQRKSAKLEMNDETTQSRLAGTVTTDTQASYFKILEQGLFQHGKFVGENPTGTQPEGEQE